MILDPDATLTEIRELVDAINDRPASSLDPAVCRLVQLVESFDEWRTAGGAMPRVWDARKRKR
jgi:hypothetical protein